MENLDRNSHTILTIESTVYPGVTRKVIHDICTELSIPIDEIATVAYSPERVSPGDPKRTVDRVARIVGCDDPKWGDYWQRSTRSRPLRIFTYVGKIEVAEASKLIENVQRDIDIAFVNELSKVLPRIGLDVEEVSLPHQQNGISTDTRLV